MLAANGCSREHEERWGVTHYPAESGYAEGERFSTRAFRNVNGSVRVGFTVMRDMPHGAIADEARAAWEFLRRFRRPSGSKTVEEIQ